MEITAAVTDTGLCQAQLVGLCDRFVQFAAAMPVRGHYWSGLRCGASHKNQACEEKRVNNRWEEIGEMRVSGGREMYWQELIFLQPGPEPRVRHGSGAMRSARPAGKRSESLIMSSQKLEPGNGLAQNINSRQQAQMDLKTRKRLRVSDVRLN